MSNGILTHLNIYWLNFHDEIDRKQLEERHAEINPPALDGSSDTVHRHLDRRGHASSDIGGIGLAGDVKEQNDE